MSALGEKASPDRLQADACRLLSALIALDTTNPPGNETPAAQLLARFLRAAGAEAELYAAQPDRACVVARIRGRGDGPSLMLLSHTDVVVAEPSDWSVPPFSGAVRDGHVWGRGALDMKGQAAASAIAVAELAKAGWQGNGDLIFCSVADEEVDVGCGLRWLVEAHPEAVRADYVLNEGGGQRLDAGSRPVYTLGVGETLASTFAIRTRGRAGHASSPLLADNALVKLAPAIERLADLDLPGPAPSALEPFVRTMAGDGVDPHELRERWRDRPEVAWLLDAMLRGSVVPSVIDASRRSTVVPGRARLVCDARLLPGLDGTDLERAVREALDGLEYDFELLEEPVGGSVSPPQGPLFDILAALVDGLEAGAALVPSLFAGFTDSHWMREAFGSVAYGFMPTRMDPLLARGLMHGADERIAVEDLGVAAALYMDAARAVGEL